MDALKLMPNTLYNEKLYFQKLTGNTCLDSEIVLSTLFPQVPLPRQGS